MDELDFLSQIFNQQQQQQGLGVLDPNAPQVPMPQQKSMQAQVKQKVMLPADVGAPILAITRPKTNVMDAVAQFSNPNFQKAFGGLQTQREGLTEWEKRMNDYASSQKAQTDLTPLLMISDALTGSKFSQMYQRPKTQQQLDMEALGLQKGLQEQKNQLSDKEIDLFKAQAGFDAASAQRQAMERIANAKIDSKGEGLTPGQEALDKKFGQEYADFIAGGGYTATEQNLQKLEQAAQALGSRDDITGPGISLLPDFARARGAETSRTIQDYVESVVQTDLKRVLGAQFTEKEGARLIARSYDPRLSEKENLSRVNALITQIRNAAKTKQEAADYFEKNGSLKGWKGSSKIKIGETSYDIAPGSGSAPTGGGQKNLQDPEFLAWKKAQGL